MYCSGIWCVTEPTSSQCYRPSTWLASSWDVSAMGKYLTGQYAIRLFFFSFGLHLPSHFDFEESKKPSNGSQTWHNVMHHILLKKNDHNCTFIHNFCLKLTLNSCFIFSTGLIQTRTKNMVQDPFSLLFFS